MTSTGNLTVNTRITDLQYAYRVLLCHLRCNSPNSGSLQHVGSRRPPIRRLLKMSRKFYIQTELRESKCRESRVRRLNRLPPTGRNPSCHIRRRPLWRCWKRNPRQDSPRANSRSQWTSQSTQLDITGHHYTAPALSYQTEQRWSALTSLCRLRRTSGCCDSLMNIWLIS